MSTNNTDNILRVKDPGTMGNELLCVPGFVCELKNHKLAGRSYVDERGGHTNLYLAALAPTAMGKEEPRDTNKKLAAAGRSRKTRTHP